MSALIIASCEAALRSRASWQSVFKEADEIWFRANLGDCEGLDACALIQFDFVKGALRARLSLELYDKQPKPVKTPELDSETSMPKWAVIRAKALRQARAGYVRNLELSAASRSASILNVEQFLRLDQPVKEVGDYVGAVEKFLSECGYPALPPIGKTGSGRKTGSGLKSKAT
jgi:hypothetical protein